MTVLTLGWLRFQWFAARQNENLRPWRWYLAAAIIVFSVLDLLLTQTILTIVEANFGEQAEANPIMAPFVMTWWAWPIRIGVPCLIVARHLRGRCYNVMAFGALLFGAVVAWNSYMYRLVLEAT